MNMRQSEKQSEKKAGLMSMTLEELLKAGYTVRLEKDNFLNYVFEKRG